MALEFLNYLDFVGSIEYDEQDQVYYGQILNITDSIAYEAKDLTELQLAFEKEVEMYLEFCKSVNKQPAFV